MYSAVLIQVFCKRDESLEDEKCSGQSSEVDNDQRRAIIKSDSLITTCCQRTQCWPSYSHLAFEVNRKGERAKQVGASGADFLKNHHFELSSSFLLCNNSEPCLDQIGMCNEKWTLSNNQSWPAQWLDWEEVPKHFLKPNLHQGRSWSLFGGLLSIWSTTAVWILVYIWEVCSASQWDAPKSARPVASIGGQMGPILLHDDDWPHNAQSMLQNLNKLGYEILPHLPSSHDLLPTDYHFIKHLDNFFFSGKTLPQPAGGRKCFPRVR